MLKYLDILKLMGPKWIVGRLIYEFNLRAGVLERKAPIQEWNQVPAPEISGIFSLKRVPAINAIDLADAIRTGQFTWFFHHLFSMGFPPDWFANPFEEQSIAPPALSQSHWSKIGDFDFGDIKCIWELSRFAWVYPLVQAYALTGNDKYCETFWRLVTDWAKKNPPNQGVNWKCGQEAAVRSFALTAAYFGFLSSGRSTGKRRELLRKILYASVNRIEANIGYALSQSNNHGVLEASGLFTGGVLFSDKNWAQKGQRFLERQVLDLIYKDGSFSQHSANYHRMMLHGCLWAICLGRENGLEFSKGFKERIRSAGTWLLKLADPITGKMPNLGANDGSLVLPMSQCTYEDYRPTIQAVGMVLDHLRWLPNGQWDDLAFWLVPDADDESRVKRTDQKEAITIFPDGGYAVLYSSQNSKLIFRCPTHFRHRPAQCDLLHVDLWLGGINILRDAGSYSYNCPLPWQDYFNSTTAHNTIQFDDHDQMPKISRFLYDHWPRLEIETDSLKKEICGGFIDWKDCKHHRRIVVTSTGYEIMDGISGRFKKAVLRWRLTPGIDWTVSDNICSGNGIRIQISVVEGFVALRIAEGSESLYYQEKHWIPVLETEVDGSCRQLTTRIDLQSAYSIRAMA
jgi:hypothetical protein